MTRDWYFYRTLPKKEFHARDHLMMRGFNVVLPIESKFRRKNRHTKAGKWVDYPLFIGYILVKVPHGDWPSIVHRFGFISECVGPRMGCLYTFSDEAANLIAAMKAQDLVNSVNTRVSFATGDMVRIVDGGYAGKEFPVADMRGKMATLMLEFFGVPREIKIEADRLEAA